MDVQTASLPAWKKMKSIKSHLLYHAHAQLTEPVSHLSGETTPSLLTFKQPSIQTQQKDVNHCRQKHTQFSIKGV